MTDRINLRCRFCGFRAPRDMFDPRFHLREHMQSAHPREYAAEHPAWARQNQQRLRELDWMDEERY